MVMKKTYKGYVDGVYGIYRGIKPDNLVVDEEIEVYYPDNGYVFTKDGEEFSAVILKENETINMYEEVERDEDNE